MELSKHFDEALVYASSLHRQQKRKGTGIPYLSHLMAVSSLVMEHDGDEEQAIAALLHDAVEDQGGLKTLAEIREKFGERVAAIVDGCTDAYEEPKPEWRQRKEAYMRHIEHAPDDIRLVSCADKLHNARAILLDYRNHGESLWDRFNPGKAGVIWYYRSLVSAFRKGRHFPLIDELDRVVSHIEKLAGE